MNDTVENTSIDESAWADAFDDVQVESEEPAVHETDEVEESETSPETEAGEEAGTEGTEPVGEADEFILKHLGIEQKVSRDDVVVLAQKGMDYDRIKQKYEDAAEKAKNYAEAEKTLSFFKELADSQSMSLEQLVLQTKAAIIAERDGISQADALNRAEYELEKQKFEQEKSDWTKQRSTETDDDTNVKADIDAFLAKFPEVTDPKSIPAEVWASVRNDGVSLTDAYTSYTAKQKDAEIAELKRQLEQEKQNNLNKSRSTGSLSSGNTKSKDTYFDSLWND